MEKIKIILVDDHQIVRDGIKALLNDAEDIDIISEAACYNELREKLKLQDPDIIVMDISLPEMSGLEITKLLSETYPHLKVLILSMYTGEDFIFNAIKAGAKGYLPKNTTRKEIIDAIHAIYNNNEYYSESISNVILKSYVQKAKSTDILPIRAEDILSTREIEILKYFAGGMSNQDIADKLFISIRTVESHKNHIMQKLELKSTVELIKYAIKNKIVDI
jgi:DNA-binding NarL/FixJ family response regulator